MENNEKNISVTLKQADDPSKSEVTFSITDIFKNMKRYFLIWFIAVVVTAMAISGAVMLLKTNISSNTVTALVNFNYKGIEEGLDPIGKTFDINKIKSPNIIESAMTELSIPLKYVESVRRNISIIGLRPNEARDQLALYQTVYEKGGSAALSAAKSMMEIGYYPSYFTISFSYGNTNFNTLESKQILDAVLREYQEYFFTTYGYNESLGNSVVAIDYSEYDYPAAIDVFDSTLTNLSDYVNRLAKQTPNFRSGKTGYSFEDLSNTIETIQSADLDSLSSYVTINNVTNDKEVLLNYYTYKIESLERQRNVYQAELKTISDSIEKYEKDSMIIFGESADNVDQTSHSLPSEKYDELIRQKTEKQRESSLAAQRIDYYNGRIKALSENQNISTDENVKVTEERLADINSKINDLIETVNQTSDEYYETVTFDHAYNILVPAAGADPSSVSKDIVIPVILSEALVFIAYFAFCIIKSITSSKENVSDDKEKDL